MDPNISKTTTGKERVVAACAESQSTSRGPNRTRFLVVQSTIRAKMQCDKKTLLAEAEKEKINDSRMKKNKPLQNLSFQQACCHL
jgi:hypothetical protein